MTAINKLCLALMLAAVMFVGCTSDQPRVQTKAAEPEITMEQWYQYAYEAAKPYVRKRLQDRWVLGLKPDQSPDDRPTLPMQFPEKPSRAVAMLDNTFEITVFAEYVITEECYAFNKAEIPMGEYWIVGQTEGKSYKFTLRHRGPDDHPDSGWVVLSIE